MEASKTYFQFGNPPFVMCEKPKSTDAEIHANQSLLVARSRQFCKSPRNSSSSGQAMNNKIAIAFSGNVFHFWWCKSNAMKPSFTPKGIEMHANASKLAKMEKVHPFSQPMLYPTPLIRRNSKNPATARFTASNIVKM